MCVVSSYYLSQWEGQGSQGEDEYPKTIERSQMVSMRKMSVDGRSQEDS